MPTPLLLVSFFSISLLGGCAAKVGDFALGKVVIYRNGVAYFERYATVEDGELSLLIAQEKVDDLLKSLKVEDVATGSLLPVAFPGRTAGNGVVRLRIIVPGKKSRKVRLSYVSESPAWKPSYRLNLGAQGKVSLQGWAIIDNVSGEDWDNVRVGVGSTSALSFRYDLWSVRDVHRQTLGHRERLATAPPTATGLRPGAQPVEPPAVATATATAQGITLGEDQVRNVPVAGRSFAAALAAAAGTADEQGISFSGSTSLENQYVIDGINTSGWVKGTAGARARSDKEKAEEQRRRVEYQHQRQAAQAETAKLERRNDELAAELRGRQDSYIIEGIASPAMPNGEAIALSMANQLRNELIERGVPPRQLAVQTRVGETGEPTSLLVKAASPTTADNEADAVEGESKFISRTPISIPHQGSSMVSIVDLETSGEVVYLYDAMSPHGNSAYAFKAVRFRNPTKQHLAGGPITVFGDDTFIGEGLADGIAPGASTLLPYALDRQIYVERSEAFSDEVKGLDRVVDDSAIVSKERLNTVTFSLHNRSPERAAVYVRHDSDRGWALRRGPENLEQLGRMSVFLVELAAGERRSLQVVESTPLTATLDLSTEEGVEALAGYLRRTGADGELAKAGRRLVAAHSAVSQKLERIDFVAGQLAMYRGRVDELHAQLVTLELVKSKGKLVDKLEERMATMSARAQAAVIEIVELREQIMMERFAFRDLLAELAALN